MGLPSIFEVFQLAIGPSMVLTTGALRIGQIFRELLLSGPYRSGYRILIELAGNFSKSGRENRSDQAVVAGLGGFTLEGSDQSISTVYRKIKDGGYFTLNREVWPFNPESDLIFNDSEKKTTYPNCIRFHLLGNSGQPAFQAEYYSTENGIVKGTGIPEPKKVLSEYSPKSFLEIKGILTAGMISLSEYVVSGECSMHAITRGHFQRRMLTTWKLMKATTDRGLKAQETPGERFENHASALYKNFLRQLSANPSAGGDQTRAAIYALALSEEILKNRPVITCPTCAGSAIVPAVLRFMQEKFLFSDEKIVESLLICGIFGSLILHYHNSLKLLENVFSEVAFSAIMASAGAAFLIGGSIDDIEKSATMAALFFLGSGQKTGHFDPRSFLLLNAMVAQTVPGLVDLSKIQPDGMIPKFDDSLSFLSRA